MDISLCQFHPQRRGFEFESCRDEASQLAARVRLCLPGVMKNIIKERLGRPNHVENKS
jgi:hypothetical protein